MMSWMKSLVYLAAFVAASFAFAANQPLADGHHTERVGDYTWSFCVENGSAVICRQPGDACTPPGPAVTPNPSGFLAVPSVLGDCPVVGIDDDALAGWDIGYELTDVELPDGLSWIGREAFCNTRIRSARLPDSVRSVGEMAFAYCYSLEDIQFGSAVTNIGEGVLYETRSLVSIEVRPGGRFVSSNGGLYDNWRRLMAHVAQCTTIRLPGALEQIDETALPIYDMPDLSFISLPTNNVNFTVQNGVLVDNRTQEVIVAPRTRTGTLQIPEGINSIADGAFFGASYENVVFPSTLKRIGADAFAGSLLQNVSLPPSVEKIGRAAFEDTDWWYEQLEGRDEGWVTLDGWVVGGNFWHDQQFVTFDEGIKGLAGGVPSDHTGWHVLSVHLPESLRYIGDEAFYGCLDLETLELPYGIADIGNDAFAENHFLREVTLPASVERIGDTAFGWCDSLRTITMLGNAPDVGYEPFYASAENLTLRVVPGSTGWNSDGSGVLPRTWPADCEDPARLVLFQAPTPQVLVSYNPAGGPRSVSILTDEEAFVRYTTNGSDPLVYGLPYEGPFAVTANMVVCAVAQKKGLLDSPVVTNVVGMTTRPKPLDCVVTSPNGSWRPAGLGMASVSPGANGHSRMTMCVVGRWAMSFKWRSSTEEVYDVGTFSVNGKPVAQISGEEGWTRVLCYLDARDGVNTLVWDYGKDGSVDRGQDTIWVEDLTFWEQPVLGESSNPGEAFGMDAAWTNTISMSGGVVIESPSDSSASLWAFVRGPANVSFDWRIPSALCDDQLSLYVDNEEVTTVSGVTELQNYVHVLAKTGVHAIEWRYTNEGQATSGAQVQNVSWSECTEPAWNYVIETTEVDGWEYEGAVLVGSDGRPCVIPNPTGHLDIPSSVDGFPVIGIDWNAFYGCDQLTSVDLPGTLEWIDFSAFERCSSLTNITVCAGTNSTRYVAIDGVLYERRYDYLWQTGDEGEHLYLVIFPKGLHPTSFDIPEGVVDVEGRWSSNLYLVSRLGLPSTFVGPVYGDSYGAAGFGDWPNLTRIDVAEGNSYYYSDDGALYSFKRLYYETVDYPVRLVFWPRNKQPVNLLATLQDLESGAFANSDQIEEIVLTTNMVSISSGAFEGCSSLKRIVVPECDQIWKSVDGVLYSATYCICPPGYEGSLVIPEGETVKYCNFDRVRGLTDVVFPASYVTAGSSYVFNGCTGLRNITFKGRPPEGMTWANFVYGSGVDRSKITIRYPAELASDWASAADELAQLGFSVSADVEWTATLPGFVFATKVEDRTFDVTFPIRENSDGTNTLYAANLYAQSSPEHVQYAYATHMWMAGNRTYQFKGYYDDRVFVKIGEEVVLQSNGDCAEVIGSFTPSATGWYPIELRVWNNGGPGGRYYGILYKTQYDDWRQFEDPGDGSLFRVEIGSDPNPEMDPSYSLVCGGVSLSEDGPVLAWGTGGVPPDGDYAFVIEGRDGPDGEWRTVLVSDADVSEGGLYSATLGTVDWAEYRVCLRNPKGVLVRKSSAVTSPDPPSPDTVVFTSEELFSGMLKFKYVQVGQVLRLEYDTTALDLPIGKRLYMNCILHETSLTECVRTMTHPAIGYVEWTMGETDAKTALDIQVCDDEDWWYGMGVVGVIARVPEGCYAWTSGASYDYMESPTWSSLRNWIVGKSAAQRLPGAEDTVLIPEVRGSICYIALDGDYRVARLECNNPWPYFDGSGWKSSLTVDELVGDDESEVALSIYSTRVAVTEAVCGKWNLWVSDGLLGLPDGASVTDLSVDDNGKIELLATTNDVAVTVTITNPIYAWGLTESDIVRPSDDYVIVFDRHEDGSLSVSRYLKSAYRHNVRFEYAEHGSLVSGDDEQTVDGWSPATAPVVKAAEGYYFKGWDTDVDCVTNDLIVKAVYVQIPKVVRFNATDRYPWNPVIDLSYELEGDDLAEITKVTVDGFFDGNEFRLCELMGGEATGSVFRTTWNASAHSVTGVYESCRLTLATYCGEEVIGSSQITTSLDLNAVGAVRRIETAADLKPIKVSLDWLDLPLPSIPSRTVWCVSESNGSDDNDGRSWAQPKTTIQSAVDAAASGDYILVGNGVYGPIALSGKTLQIISVYGAARTTIDGNGESRCVTVSSGSVTIRGFTLRRGVDANNGGGAYGGTLVDCVLRDCEAYNGAGAYNATTWNCTYIGNLAYDDGSAVWGGVHYDCEMLGNHARNDGGSSSGAAFSARLYNCRVYGNTAIKGGGAGIDSCTAYGCDAHDNIRLDTNQAADTYSCTIRTLAEGGVYAKPVDPTGVSDGTCARAVDGALLLVNGNVFASVTNDYAEIAWSPKSAGTWRLNLASVVGGVTNQPVEVAWMDCGDATVEPLYTLTFDLGENGTRIGGGALVQRIVDPEAVVMPPTVKGKNGMVFVGWDTGFAGLSTNALITAQYRTAKADLHVDFVDVPFVGDERMTFEWTVGNTGNPSWSGTLIEEIRLVDATNDLRTITVARLSTPQAIGCEETIRRAYEWQIPEKGYEGVWRVLVETAIGSANEHGGDNAGQFSGFVRISARPLPDLSIKSIDLSPVPTDYRPGEMVTVSYVEQNTGTASAGRRVTSLYVVKGSTRIRLASVTEQDELAPGATRDGVFEVVLPESIAISGDVTFFVKADANDDVVEKTDDDDAEDAIWLERPNATLAKVLILTASATSVGENGSGVRYTVRRSGETDAALTLTVVTEGATKDIRCPESVTINRGSSSASFTVYPNDNSVVDGTRYVALRLAADEGLDYVPATHRLEIRDNEMPSLTITLSTDKLSEGGEKIIVTVTRDLVTDEPLTVYLTGATANRCTCPASVVIPAGAASVTFEIEAVDDDLAQIAAELTLRASAAGYSSAAKTFTVEDNDIPGVTLALTPEVVSEGAGPQAVYATLTRNDQKQIDKAVRVQLTPSEENQLILPGEVTIPKYTMAVRFAIGVIDNALDDVDREVAINGAIVIESCGCSGQPSNGEVIQAVVGIIDNDGPSLSLTASPATMKEGADPAGYLILTHNSVLEEDLTVRLWVDTENADELLVPESFVIPAGETSVQIPVVTLDDGVEDGGQLVSVYVEDAADVFAPASTWVQVSDQNLPDLKVKYIDVPLSVSAGETMSVEFGLTNTGFVDCSGELEYSVHLVQSSGGAVASDANKIADGRIFGLAMGEEKMLKIEIEAPIETGDYCVIVSVDPKSKINELDRSNNTTTSEPLTVNPAYSATVGAAGKVFLPGDAVVFTGLAVGPDGMTPMPNVAVDLYVIVNGLRRVFSLTTSADGSFGMTYRAPESGGRFTVGASYPGVGSSLAQDYFDVLAMTRATTNNIIWDYALGDSLRKMITIRNASQTPLTGLSVETVDVPAECELTCDLPEVIPAGGTITLSMTATAVGISSEVDYSRFLVRIASAEGAVLEFPAFFHSQSQKADLKVEPTRIDTTMAIGTPRYIDVTITNDGKGDTGRIDIDIPAVRWLRIVGGETIGSLLSGESAVVTLEVSPEESDGLVLNSPLSGGQLVAQPVNGKGVSVPLRFTPVSDATGLIVVDAVDNNTYTLAGRPHLAGAAVRVTNPYTGAVVATGVTGCDGLWTSNDLAEGVYQVVVTAEKHDSYSGSVTVEPGRSARVDAFLQYSLVTASWSVVPTEIEDSYEVQMLLEYETSVPAPIVKTVMPEQFEDLAEGESTTFVMTVMNAGLIAAEKVTISPPDIPDHTFTLSENGFRLAAGESRDVVVKFEHKQKAIRALKSSGKTGTVIGTWLMKHLIEYMCGDHNPTYGYDKSFKYGRRIVIPGEEIIVPVGPGPGPSQPGEPTRIEPHPIGPGTPGDLSQSGFTVSINACSPCFQSALGCLLDIAVNLVPGNASHIVECILSLIDCGLGLHSLIDDHSLLNIGRKIFDCGMSVVGCLNILGDWIQTIISCVENIGIDCFVQPYLDNQQSGGGARMAKAMAAVEVDSQLKRLYPEFAAAIAVARSAMPAYKDWCLEYFGDEAWTSADASELVAFLSSCKASLNSEGDRLSVEALLPHKPSAISDEQLARFVLRMNNMLSGSEGDALQPAGEGDVMRVSVLMDNAKILDLCQAEAKAHGYETFVDFLREEANKIIDDLAERQNSVCASVRLSLSQTVSMTREAFNGTLTMYNGHEYIPLTDLKLELSVLDADGNLCNDLFVMRDLETTGSMSSGSVLEGGLSVAPGGEGSAVVQFIPSRFAADEEPKAYRFGGKVRYTDPFTGKDASISLIPVTLTVHPSPYLKLHYFIQRDVYGDDPNTEAVEASMPAEMSLLMVNEGSGDARNVTISSVQPEIVQNDKGLLIDFALKDYSLDAMALNGATAHLGLNNVSIGTIPAGESQVAQWWLTASLDGHFTSMSARVLPVNSWNTPDTMLVNPDVGMHKLIRSLQVDGVQKPYFLVSEDASLYGLPNAIYTPSGESLAVGCDTNASVSGSPKGAESQVHVTVSPTSSGWNYADVLLPGASRYTVISVTRDDGKVVPERNVWITSKVFRDGKDPLNEDHLHLADELPQAGPTGYVIMLQAKPTDTLEVVSFGIDDDRVESSVRDGLVVTFSASVDPSTFTIDDLVLRNQGLKVEDLSALTIAAVGTDGRSFEINGLGALCSVYGRYELTVQCAGLADLTGQLGSVGKSVSWTYASSDSPYIVDAEGIPTKAVRRLDSIVVVTSSAVDPQSFAEGRIRLNGEDVSGSLVVRAIDTGCTRFAIEGLELVQHEDGAYTMTIDGSDLRGLDGAVGVNTFSRSWTRDTIAPVLESVTRETGMSGTRILLAFSEKVDAATLTVDQVQLTRDGLVVAWPSTVKLEELAEGVYAVSGFDSITMADGVYACTVNSTGVTDAAGNAASSEESVTWVKDTTAPAQPTMLAVSSGYGSVDTVVQTCERRVTVSGVAPETGVTVQILCKYVGGAELLLAMPSVSDEGAFTAEVALPETGGNLMLIVRLTDASGNTSDAEIKTYYDKVALTVELSGAPELDVPVESMTLSFSDVVMGEDVTLSKFALTCNREPIALDGVTLVPNGDGKTFTLHGLTSLCATDGEYVLSFAATDVRKRSSGLKASACAPLTWHYQNPDCEPPVVVSVRIDGEESRGVYTNGISSVAIEFNESVDISDLVKDGLIDQTLRIDLLDAGLNATGTVRAVGSDVACRSDGVVWTLPNGAVGPGHARLVLEAGLITDLAGNRLAGDADFAVDGFQDFDFNSAVIARVDSYAMPTWYDTDGDGLVDLVVGEKTAAGVGKVRVYRNAGTATELVFDGYTFLKAGSADLSITASGCQGAQVAFGDLTGDGHDDLIVGFANGQVQMWHGTATRGEYGESEVLVTGSEQTYGSSRAFVCPCDLDGDGKLELVIGGMDGKFRLLKIMPDGSSTESWLVDDSGLPLTVAAGRSTPVLADVNNDGCVDILSGDTAGNVWVFLGKGETWNATPVCVFDNAQAKLSDRSRIGYGDVNGDGIGDLLVGRTNGSVELAFGVRTESPVFVFRIKGTYTVTFDLGEYGTLVSGGLVQSVVEGDAAVAPEVTVDDRYVFDGWDGEFTSITSDTVIRAKYTHRPLTLAEAVDAPDMTFETEGSTDWTPEWGDRSSDAEHYAIVRGVGDNASAWLQTMVDGPGEVSFAWKCDLAARTTKLQFFVDDVAQGVVSGLTQWTPVSVTVYGEGPHTLRWRLFTGRSGAAETDVGAVDCVTWTPAVPPTLAEALNKDLVWTTKGDVAWRGVAKASKLDTRDAWAEVAALGDNATATVATRVYGSGLLMFDWAVSCEEEYDWLEVSVDGEVRTYVTGDVGWRTDAVDIVGEGWHTVRWSYCKDELDDPDLAGANKAMLDNVVWLSDDEPPAEPEKTATESTPVPVPFEVIEDKYGTYLEAENGDYEAAANAIGKNGCPIWESFVAGLDPDKADSKFEAKITMVDGKPVISWEPALNGHDESGACIQDGVRIYRVFGSSNLTDWKIVPDGKEGDFRFFKVEVLLP